MEQGKAKDDMDERDIDCEQALKQVLTYIDHELAEGEREAMQRHLHRCKSCFSRMEFERLLKVKVRSLRDEPASEQLSERVKSLLKEF